MSEQHPLISAIELKNKAIKSNAHPSIIKKLEDSIAAQVEISLQKLFIGTDLDIKNSLLYSTELNLNQK